MNPSAARIETAVHTGQCRAPRPVVQGRDRGYCLHDTGGQPVGTITAPATRPVLAPSAPTVYLRRD